MALKSYRQPLLKSYRHAAPSMYQVVGRSRCVPVFASGAPFKVLLTREPGKNEKMRGALTWKGFTCKELPLIEHTAGPDRDRLPSLLSAAAEQYDWVTITSPEAAAVFLEGWDQAGKPKVRVAVVGGGSGEVLLQGGITPDYVPSKALGKVMGLELPRIPGGTGRVLYPASVKATTDLQDSLAAAGFEVHRINTYNTVPVKSVPESLLREALTADVVTFGSPSAVKAWVGLAGLEVANSKVNACIGATSAKACAAAGITENVYFPDSPSIEGWVDAVERGCKDLLLALPAATV
ncbi:hypothetical protein Vretimale_6475 [Volvox reticuliferus]|uniref:Uroporphyrinogen-III synthase n=1 Tax=Volvox reticuliferus TaxID=1737510 RepID=A0A8J4D0C0_9CHLO|nr:hypothetical protein Vretifemale_19963 [Volvox reticuliferus]GIM01677.1 hypothetical protein Vretimale_6475 [Volvox reticuliferus]